MYPDENRDSSSFGPDEQLSINNGRLFTLTKVVKIRSEVMVQKKINLWVSTAMKNVDNSGIIKYTLMKIEILVVSNSLNKF